MAPDVIVALVSKQFPQGPPNFGNSPASTFDGPKGPQENQEYIGERVWKLSSFRQTRFFAPEMIGFKSRCEIR